MKKKDVSFWSDIKTLDERLKRDPDSFCFARLSEIYLMVGLVADALHTARMGVSKHPDYLAGQRALAMACNASGLHDECRSILEQVTAAMPEDIDAQKLLASQYVAAGDLVSAIRTHRTVLDFRPDDAGSAVELEALQYGSTTCSRDYVKSGQIESESDVFGDENNEDEIIDLSESDIHEEFSEEEIYVETPPVAVVASPERHDPLSTLTLAELYEQQGFLVKACEIYRTILAEDPSNEKLRNKIAQLEGFEPDSEIVSEDTVEGGIDEDQVYIESVASENIPATFESQLFESTSDIPESIIEPDFSTSKLPENVPAQFESQLFEPLPENMTVEEPDLSVSDAFEDNLSPLESQFFEPLPERPADRIEQEFSISQEFEEISTPLEPQAFAPLAHIAADNVVDTLDSWLENIRRIKACR